MASKQITFHRCIVTDESIAASLCIREEEDPRLAQDRADRLSAFSCERCQSLVDHMLRLESGEAVCDGCFSEAKEAPDGE